MTVLFHDKFDRVGTLAGSTANSGGTPWVNVTGTSGFLTTDGECLVAPLGDLETVQTPAVTPHVDGWECSFRFRFEGDEAVVQPQFSVSIFGDEFTFGTVTLEFGDLTFGDGGHGVAVKLGHQSTLSYAFNLGSDLHAGMWHDVRYTWQASTGEHHMWLNGTRRAPNTADPSQPVVCNDAPPVGPLALDVMTWHETHAALTFEYLRVTSYGHVDSSGWVVGRVSM